MKVYIAGPMRGIMYYNFPAFDYAKAELEERGFEVISPADLDRANGFDALDLLQSSNWSAIPDHFDFEACVDRDLKAIKECGGIYMLDGWELSTGATAEHALAVSMQKEIMYETPPVIEPETAKESNPKDVIGSSKLPLHLWPITATAMGCIGMLNGSLKYGRSNFRAVGIRASIYYDAAKRHLDAWFEGEEIDPDDQVPHLSAALSCLAIIVDAQAAGKMVDDRMIQGGYRKLRDEMTEHVGRLKEFHKDREPPKHYTIADSRDEPRGNHPTYERPNENGN